MGVRRFFWRRGGESELAARLKRRRKRARPEFVNELAREVRSTGGRRFIPSRVLLAAALTFAMLVALASVGGSAGAGIRAQLVSVFQSVNTKVTSQPGTVQRSNDDDDGGGGGGDDDDDGDDDGSGDDSPDVGSPPNPLPIGGGQYPPEGSCRVWIPWLSAGQQAPPTGCAAAESGAPAGTWVLYSPAVIPEIHVRVIHPDRSGLVVRVWIYDQAGRLLREEDRYGATSSGIS
jgi:hypothetical protein